MGLNAKNMNYDELPFNSQVIILDNVIEHENLALLKECHRVLEFGGTIIVLVQVKRLFERLRSQSLL